MIPGVTAKERNAILLITLLIGGALVAGFFILFSPRDRNAEHATKLESDKQALAQELASTKEALRETQASLNACRNRAPSNN